MTLLILLHKQSVGRSLGDVLHHLLVTFLVGLRHSELMVVLGERHEVEQKVVLRLF